MFLPIFQDADYGACLAWMTTTYVLWGSVAYTVVNIPYGSMASVISGKPEDRASLSVFRSLGATLANVFISVILPLVVYINVDGVSQLSSARMILGPSPAASSRSSATPCATRMSSSASRRRRSRRASGWASAPCSARSSPTAP